ncbi:MAG: hypothetical protein L6406_11440 [Desulfobacterales bacterium]|nr:hypothetical protein [Desulfobacterales bacterium]
MVESSKATNKATTNTGRNSSISAGIDSLVWDRIFRTPAGFTQAPDPGTIHVYFPILTFQLRRAITGSL